MCPRVSTTSNQSIWRIDFDAVSIALRIAASVPSLDEPTISTSL